MILRAATMGILISAGALAQERFDVASIKPMNVVGEGSGREVISADPVTLTLRNVTLSSAIQWAYDVKYYQVSGPGWLNERRYEISAKSAMPAGENQMRAMLQALLADRFKLKVHREGKDATVYALTVAKGGIKMTPADPNGQSVLQGGGPSVSAKDTSVADIVEMLSRATRKFPGDVPPVVDMTGLAGRYSFSVDGSSVLQAFGAEAQKTGPDPSALIGVVQDVLEKQLGLHSDLRKARIDLLVVDHAEQSPSSD